MALTTLATLLNRMDRYQTMATINEVYKVRDLDESIRNMKRTHRLPFLNRKGSLRVFPDVLLYPVPSDYDYLVYMDTSNDQVDYGLRMRARYTSLQQFYEDPDYRNTIAEIWDTNTLMLGVRDKNVPPGFSSGSQTLDNAGSISNYTASLDANSLYLNTVLFTDNANSSIQFTNTPTVTDQALVSWTFDSFTDARYQSKYFFVQVFLSGIPDSITLRFGEDSSDYLATTVTTQFSGQAFKTDQWNLLAFDLNTATTTGTVNTNTEFQYAALQLNNAPAGLYNIGPSYLRGWTLLDCWYYSTYVVQTEGASQPDAQFFINDAGEYDLADSLIGSTEWADVIMYDAMLLGLADKENDSLFQKISLRRDEAMTRLMQVWPDMHPLEITLKLRFQTDYLNDWNNNFPGF